MAKMGLGAALLVMVLCEPLGLAATLRVPGDYSTVQAAVSAAKPGDVILIAPGLYPETVSIVGKSGLTLKGDVSLVVPGDYTCCPDLAEVAAVIIRGLRIANSTGITVETLTVTPLGIEVSGTTALVVEVTFRYCRVVRSDLRGMYFTGQYQKINVLGCEVSYNGWDGIFLDGNGADILVENCCVNYNGQKSAAGVGIRIGQLVRGVVIRQNCIEGNAFAGIHPH